MAADSVSVDFSATINLTPQDVEDAGGDLIQAVQNVVGHTGAMVVQALGEK